MSINVVLVVDDSPVERHFLSEILTQAGFRVITAENGEDARIKCMATKPDLILMDVVMPGQNGFQATRAFSKDDLTKNIPIILCTSKGQETDKLWGIRQGARDYIVKPVNRNELLLKIAALG